MGDTTTLDMGPADSRGAIKARSARFIWRAGWLYVVSKNGTGHRVQSMETDKPVEPPEPNGYWHAEGPDGRVSWSRRGCGGCSSNYRALRSIPIEDIVNA